jgi:hypothetical protein
MAIFEKPCWRPEPNSRAREDPRRSFFAKQRDGLELSQMLHIAISRVTETFYGW